jgi:hypothetical protein
VAAGRDKCQKVLQDMAFYQIEVLMFLKLP